MADRMNATTERIDGSHVAFISRPVTVAAFIASAVANHSSAAHCRSGSSAASVNLASDS